MEETIRRNQYKQRKKREKNVTESVWKQRKFYK